jgi:rhodanese-related sulfurtransferase
MSKRLSPIVSLLLVMMLVLSACGAAEPTAEPVSSAPLAEAVAAPTEAPAPEPTAAPVAEAMPAVDVTGIVGEYLAAIPDGFMNVGKIDAFKEAVAAGAILIDVRETSEYEAGHIPGAVNVPLRTLTQNLDKIPSDMPVFVYCASGHRAGLALSSLRVLGYDNVKAFSPGWKGWSGAGEEVSMEAVAGESYEVPVFDEATFEAVDNFVSNIPEGWLTIGDAEKLDEAIAAGAVLVDVREPGEYADGAIPNALSIPIRTIGANLSEIPMDAPVVVYCASGFRAALSTAALQIMGYTNVRSFPPSYAGWEAAHGESGDVPAEVAAAVDSDFDVVAVVSDYLAAIPEGYMNVGKIEAFKEAIENTSPVLIDVREASEYEAGHIPGAVNIPLRTLTENLDKIPSDMPVFVYCASGHRAGMALSSLRVLGYDNVKAYSPGWKGWTAANEEVSTEMVEAATYPVKEVNAEALAAVSEFLTNMPEGWLALGTAEKLQEAIDIGAQLVDVREPSEFEAGAITDALNIPIRSLGAELAQIATDKPVVVYCASGFRAALSTAALQIMGYSNVRSFPPSYAGWEAAQ